MSPMLLEVDDVSVRLGGISALKGVSFAVRQGEIVSVIGPNGAGKTTLFNIITGFRRANDGAVRFDGKPIGGFPPHRIAKLGLVRTFQKTEVFPDLTVFECARVGLLNHFQPGLLAVLLAHRDITGFVDQAPAAVGVILETVGLAHKARSAARELSYGEQRLLEVAVGLAARPRLLLLDEPASGLNGEEVARLAQLVRALRNRGVTIVLIEHNMAMVMDVSDRIVVLHHGEKIAEDTPDAVSRDSAVVSAYLGREWADA
jgi:branched-chain amino acid transport system ATP-binding protein